MATAAAEKRRLLARLGEVDRQAASLDNLRQQIRDAIAEVGAEIAGSVTGQDRRILELLQLNLEELDRSIQLMRNAVEAGRDFVAQVPE
ncbi:hypothetical protein [Cryptosporangium sp. NPDC048952]|uniref:hypothetical protein n=1 Tax=Cryptosporangium sp. NPDC048952 TaxID=3363961 RepID=UPI00371921B7